MKSEEARERRKARATERYRERWRTDPVFRERERKRRNERKRKRYRTDAAYRKRMNALKHQNRRRLYRRTKAEVLARLGGACVVCGETDERVLTVDHVDGDGHRHRMRQGAGAQRDTGKWGLYLRAIVTGSHRLQLLCFNHHAVKDLYAAEHTARVQAGWAMKAIRERVVEPQGRLWA